jgi:hypothetical protein
VQVQGIIHYREHTGDFLSVYELQSVPELEASDIYRILPFIIVTDPTSRINATLINRIQFEGENYFLLRYSQGLQKKEGFLTSKADDRFAGSPAKMYVRFRSSRPGDFSFGFTAEKDEGEKFQWNPSAKQYGFDYISFHAQLLHKKEIKNIILGDFQAQFGQGLILGGGFGMGKSGETVAPIRRSNIGFTPYTSVFEAGGFRGIAGTFAITKRILCSSFLASNRRDANLTNEQDVSISSFQNTGLHRNTKELEKRKSIQEDNAGIVMQYQTKNFDIGVLTHWINFSQPVNKQAMPYNQFVFEGKSNINSGIYLNYTWQNLSFFSEAARSMHGGTAMIAGMLGSLSPKFDFTILARTYGRNFYSFYGSALSENTTAQNERGIYWGWKYRFSRAFSIGGYTDLFYFPWLKFRSYKPSHGGEYLLRFDYQPSRKMLLTVQVRTETKERNRSAGNILYEVSPGRKRNFLITSQYGVGQPFRFKTRVQYSQYSINQKTTDGVALIQDLHVEQGKFEFNLRYCLFDTDDFDNRQYAYESDVWLAYSLPAYDGRGVRKVLVVTYKLNRHWSLWCRFSRTRYADRVESGSGVEAIHGNVRDEVKIQVMIRF